MYIVFTHMLRGSYQRWFEPIQVPCHSCGVCWALLIPLLCWLCHQVACSFTHCEREDTQTCLTLSRLWRGTAWDRIPRRWRKGWTIRNTETIIVSWDQKRSLWWKGWIIQNTENIIVSWDKNVFVEEGMNYTENIIVSWDNHVFVVEGMNSAEYRKHYCVVRQTCLCEEEMNCTEYRKHYCVVRHTCL